MKMLTSLLFLFFILFLTGCKGPGFGDKVHKEYFPNGTLRSEFIMSDNTAKNGTMKMYGTQGELTSVVNIRNGVKHGVEVMYDPQGRVLMRTPYVNGLKHGEEKIYYPNQTILATIPYRFGRKNGIGVKYYSDGKVQQKVRFKDDRIVN
ncbi:Phophatidylinositol-4-phosphate 5-kinase [hydrothermal vent metagenome]|uniref:Phophatidylinositol-4-phosphate 5-kinase n=1 Tax=hydrothermal vent metagenome TaxID=652676 RepID=A0A1W1BTP4_9ZZZZ|nr:hypothetical protein [Sulfurovum sp.]